MKKPSELATKDIIKQKETDPYLTLVNSRVKSLSLKSEQSEFLLCKKSFVRLLKTKLSGETDNEFIEGFEKYTFRLGNMIDTLKNHLEWSQKCLQSHKDYIESKDTIKDRKIKHLVSMSDTWMQMYERESRENKSLRGEITLLKANPDRKKGGTITYFGKLSIEKN